jgi:hypothetical protein
MPGMAALLADRHFPEGPRMALASFLSSLEARKNSQEAPKVLPENEPQERHKASVGWPADLLMMRRGPGRAFVGSGGSG